MYMPEIHGASREKMLSFTSIYTCANTSQPVSVSIKGIIDRVEGFFNREITSYRKRNVLAAFTSAFHCEPTMFVLKYNMNSYGILIDIRAVREACHSSSGKAKEEQYAQTTERT